MNRTSCLLALLALEFGLAGCAALPHAPPPALPLLTPASLGTSQAAQQSVRIARDGSEQSLRGIVQVDGATLTLIGLDPLGRRVLTLRYDGEVLSADAAAALPPGVEPARLLADVQLALWPLPAWKAALAGSRWQLTEPVAGVRRLRYDERLVAELHYAGSDPWRGRVWLVNFVHDYAVDLTSAPP